MAVDSNLTEEIKRVQNWRQINVTLRAKTVIQRRRKSWRSAQIYSVCRMLNVPSNFDRFNNTTDSSHRAANNQGLDLNEREWSSTPSTATHHGRCKHSLCTVDFSLQRVMLIGSFAQSSILFFFYFVHCFTGLLRFLFYIIA